MKNIFPIKLFTLIFLGLITIPYLALANVVSPYHVYDWSRIILFSLMVFLTGFLVWALSPLGLIFIASALTQFLIPKKEIRIVAWVFQGLVFAFTILLGIIGIIFSLSLPGYNEGRYVFLIGISGAVIIICLLMIGAMIAQSIWQKRKRDIIQ